MSIKKIQLKALRVAKTVDAVRFCVIKARLLNPVPLHGVAIGDRSYLPIENVVIKTHVYD